MVSYAARRLLQAATVMIAVAFACFLIFNFVGDPVDNLVGQEATVADREALRAGLGLDDPVAEQFARFVAGAARGEFGISYRLQRPVAELIAERLPATLELVLASAVLALALGIPLGVRAAVGRHAWSSRLIMLLSLAGVSLPTFVIGILLIYVFSVSLGVLPSFGRGETVALGWWSTGLLSVSGWKAILMPAVTLGLFQMTIVLRLVRSEMLEVLRSDHVRFARARGLPERAITYRHALRNALVPVITVAGLNVGSLIAFSIVTETVFQWPGMGLLFIQAVGFADVPVMAAYLMMVSLLFVAINFAVDMLYFAVDPRLRAGLGTEPP